MSILAQLPGQVLDEKYQIDRELGKGGMGAVYKATHLGTKRAVALKVITPQFMANEQFVERFRREAEAAGRLRHPNVVNVTDFGFARVENERIAYLVMEYLDGFSLGDLLKRQPRPALDFIVDITEQICLAIDNAHQQGIIHRDLKPDNIWLEPNGRGGYNVKMLDFGLAKLREPGGNTGRLSPGNGATGQLKPPLKEPSNQSAAQSPAKSSEMTSVPLTEAITGVQTEIDPEGQTQVQMVSVASEGRTHVMDPLQTVGEKELSTLAGGNLTQAGAVLGTPIYMSPEQCLSRQLDARSDIYSLGVVLYEMLAGKPPFSGSPMQLMVQHVENAPPSLGELRPDIPVAVVELVMSTLAKRAEERPPSAGTFANALRANIEGEVQVIRQARFYSSNFMLIFILMALVNFLPFMLLLMLFSLALKLVGVNYPLIASLCFWPINLLMMLVASKVNTGSAALVVAELRRAPLSQIKIGRVLSEIRPKLSLLFSVAVRSLAIILTNLFKLIRPGVQRYLDYAFIAPVAVLEQLDRDQVLSRSQVLVERLRSIVTILQIREISISLISMLFFSGTFSLTMILMGAPYDERFNMFKLPGPLTVFGCWYFLFFGHSMYVALPISVLYFRARQANGEILNEDVVESRPEELLKRRRRFSNATWGWIIVPMLMLATAVAYPILAQYESLVTAVRNGSDKTVKQLLTRGANTNAADFFGRTPLMMAAREGFIEIARQLQAAGAQVNVADSDGDTPLIYAARSGYDDIVELLIKSKAEINIQNSDGETPLICAVKRGRLEVVALLLRSGADVNRTDKSGKTALTYATEEDRRDILELLKKATSGK